MDIKTYSEILKFPLGEIKERLRYWNPIAREAGRKIAPGQPGASKKGLGNIAQLLHV